VKSKRSPGVSNAGPLIHLAKISLLHLFKTLFQKLIIPLEVKVGAVDLGKEKGSPDAIHIEKAIDEGWIKVEEVKLSKGFKDVAKVAGLRLAEVATICV
jgi:predicted nucleic acid-binding protein